MASSFWIFRMRLYKRKSSWGLYWNITADGEHSYKNSHFLFFPKFQNIFTFTVYQVYSSSTNEQRNFGLRSLVVKGCLKYFSPAATEETRAKPPVSFHGQDEESIVDRCLPECAGTENSRALEPVGTHVLAQHSFWSTILRLHSEDWVEAWSHLTHQQPFSIYQLSPHTGITRQDNQVGSTLKPSTHSFQWAPDPTVLLCL